MNLLAKPHHHFCTLLVIIQRVRLGNALVHLGHDVGEGVGVGMQKKQPADLRHKPRPVPPAAVGRFSRDRGVPKEEVGVVGDGGAFGSVGRVRLDFWVHGNCLPILLPPASLDEEHLRFPHQGGAHLHDPREVAQVDRGAVCTVDDPIFPVTHNEAHEAVVRLVVAISHFQHELYHPLAREVFVDLHFVVQEFEQLDEVGLVHLCPQAVRMRELLVHRMVELVIINNYTNAVRIFAHGVEIIRVTFDHSLVRLGPLGIAGPLS